MKCNMKTMLKIVGLVWSLCLAVFVHGQSPQTYLVSDFNEEEFGKVMELCHQGGFEYLLHRYPFSSYGHYGWNPSFASKGNRSVASMVNKAAERGVKLGVYAQMDAVSTNDAYFSSRYFSQLSRLGQVDLLCEITADQTELTVHRNDVLNIPSTLNLLLIGKELITYGTLEPVGDLMLLHHCNRGLYGTKSVAHKVSEPVYKLWDSPERFCAPDGDLIDSVRLRLTDRLDAVGISFMERSDQGGHLLLNESQRVKNVERWEQEYEERNPNDQPMQLGWCQVRVSDRMQPSTALHEVEWFLAKAAAYHAGYGMLVSRGVMERYGQLDRVMELVKRWNRLRDSGLLTEEQKESLRDPYADWHLEPFDDTHYLLFPLQVSRRYRCRYELSADGLGVAEPWEWKSEDGGQFGLCIQVEGKGEIVNPEIETENGVLRFPCVIKANQFLWYDYEDKAVVTDLNYHTIAEVIPEGDATLPFGASQVSFRFNNKDKTKRPEVSVRYILRETPMVFEIPSETEE